MKKLLLLTILSGTMLALAACGGSGPPAAEAPTATPEAAQEAIPTRPDIRAIVLGEEYAGLPGAYCWLQAPNDVRCEPDPLDMQPDTTITVEAGDTVTFAVEGEEGMQPSALRAVLLDDTDDTGRPVEIDFGATDSADYEVDLEPGMHRVSVVAEFAGSGGDNNFVSSIFAIEVPMTVAEATEAPTATTAPPTSRPEETEAAAEETTVKPPAEATEEATEEQPVATATPEIPTATEAPSETPIPSPTTAPPTAVPSPTIAAPTLPPPSPTQAEPPSGGGEAVENAPAVVLINGGRAFQPSGMRYCYRDTSGSEVCVDSPASPESERILLNSGDTIRLDAEAGGPLTMTVILASSDLAQEYQRTELAGSSTAVSLHTISAAAGNYVLVVETTWPDSTATYYFRLQVVG